MYDMEDGFKIHLANKSEKAHASLKGHNASVLSAGSFLVSQSVCFPVCPSVLVFHSVSVLLMLRRGR